MTNQADAAPAAHSIRRLFDGPKLALDQSPVLRGLFDRFAVESVALMKPLCEAPVTFSLAGVTTGSIDANFHAYRDGVCGVFEASALGTQIVVGLSNGLASVFIDAIFGGDGAELIQPVERPLSTTEVRVMTSVVETLANGLASVVSSLEPVTLAMQRVAAGNDGKTFGIKNQSAICAEFQVDVFGNSGLMTVAIPEAALLPFRRKLERDDTEAVPQLDLVWHDRLMAQIASADVQMDAVIDGPRLSIGEVSTLRVNQMLKLPALTEALLSFESMDCALFQCRLGQSDGTFTVQVERCVGRPDGY